MTITYTTCLAGMMAANAGLQNTANNVAHQQNSGYKRTDITYGSLSNQDFHHALGGGVYIQGKTTNFRAGNYIETNNPSDLAVIGDGFFVIRLENGSLRYTRNGAFQFNQEGFLHDPQSGGLVQGLDQNGHLVAIRQSSSATNLGKRTEQIDLKGNFVYIPLEDNGVTDPNPTKSHYAKIVFDIPNVYDSQGKEHTLTLEFEAPHMPQGIPGIEEDCLTWNLVDIHTRDGASIHFLPQSIAFDNIYSGGIKSSHNMIRLALNGDPVKINFGEYNDDDAHGVKLHKKDVPQYSETRIGIKTQDGYGIGKQTDWRFNEDGQIVYQYDNGQNEHGVYIALAHCDNLQQTLHSQEGSLFEASPSSDMQIGKAHHAGLGTIQSQKIEAANVDTTTEFANIVVLQRMFQACSQIMDTDKQLLEALYKK